MLGVAVFSANLVGAPPKTRKIGPAPAAAKKVSDEITPDVKVATIQNRRIHALIIGTERDPNIGSGVGPSGARLKSMLESTFQDQVQINTVGFFSPDLASPGNGTYDLATVLRAIAELRGNVGPDDVVFCYVMSHGAFDPGHNDPKFENGHWFQTERLETLPRVNLMQDLLGLNARLTVLISDSCNVPVRAARVSAAPAVAAPAGFNNPALFSLLIEYEGQVDISASSENQFAFYFPNAGGLFTDTFVSLAANDHRFTWSEFFNQLRDETEADFRAQIGSYPNPDLPGGVQTSLTPKQLRNPNWVRPYQSTAQAAAVKARAAVAPAPPAPPKQ